MTDFSSVFGMDSVGRIASQGRLDLVRSRTVLFRVRSKSVRSCKRQTRCWTDFYPLLHATHDPESISNSTPNWNHVVPSLQIHSYCWHQQTQYHTFSRRSLSRVATKFLKYLDPWYSLSLTFLKTVIIYTGRWVSYASMHLHRPIQLADWVEFNSQCNL